ncbi:hypothetical protein COBT_000291 [Conglomerata obtusa]
MQSYKNFKLSSLPPYAFQTIPTLTSINNNFQISNDLSITTLYKLLLPSFFIFFTGPLTANLVHVHFKLTPETLIAYFTGLILFVSMRKFKFLRRASTLAPLLGKICVVVDMKNSTVPVYLLCFWVMVCSFVGIVVSKVMARKEIELTEEEFGDVMGTVLCIAGCRYFMVCDFVAICVVVALYLVNKKANFKSFFNFSKSVITGDEAIKNVVEGVVEGVDEFGRNMSDDNATISVSEHVVENDTLRTPKRRVKMVVDEKSLVTPKRKGTEDGDENKTKGQRGRPRKNDSKMATPKKSAARKVNFDEEE